MGLLGETQRRLAVMRGAGPPTQVHVCARVGTYRGFARRLPRPTDTVVELGSAEGHTTLHLARRAARVFAIEQSAAAILRARRRCTEVANIEWLELDAFDTHEVAHRVPAAELVFIDIGGSTWPALALRAATIYHYLFRPRALVVRNVPLNGFVAAVASCEAPARRGPWDDPGE